MTSVMQATGRVGILLEKCISGYITLRPASLSSPWSPFWNEYFLHHKCWKLLNDTEVLPLISKRFVTTIIASYSSSFIDRMPTRPSGFVIYSKSNPHIKTKRRHEIGGFFILNSDPTREVFAKFVQNNGDMSSQSSTDVVIYQVLSRSDGIFVDIHMEATPRMFRPYSMIHYNTPTPFNRIYQVVKSRDIDCAENVHSRTNLLAVFDTAGPPDDDLIVMQSSSIGMQQAQDVLRLIKLSASTKMKLRFFNSEGTGAANDLLRRLTAQYIISTSFQTQAAKLSIDENMPILQHFGSWFIMRVDWYVLSIACLDLQDQIQGTAENLQSIRELSFFTVGSYDLYQSDDDLSDAKTASENANCGSDHFDLTIIESDHAENFARACYLALRDHANPIQSLYNDEVSYAMSSLSFEECLQIFITVDDLSALLNSDAPTVTGAKLCAVIESMLKTVPGSDEHLFYFCGDEIDHSVTGPSIDDSRGDAISVENQDAQDGRVLEAEESNKRYSDTDNPPLFFTFTLNQERVGFKELLALKKSVTLAAQVSVFREKSLSGTINSNPRRNTSHHELPEHVSIVSKLHFQLNRFSSEQTLEKYRFMGQSLTVEILEEVMLTLPKTNHKSCEIQLQLFNSKSNSLVVVGENNDNDLLGFDVLVNEFNSDFTRASQDSFLVLDDSASREVLPYWCFVEIQLRVISIRIYHPSGDEAAEEQLQVAQSLVQNICHRTNQLLMLESLYKTKRACTLLIAEPADMGGEDCLVSTRMLASYSCPIQFKARIPLHRRCAPQQAVAELETHILQNFIVSNANGIFVYKDESENIFYMRLSWSKVPDIGEAEQNPHKIELLVHGCDKPGHLITDQLVCLLKRKALTLTLDALSSLLKKNPRFNMLSSDLAFIKGFASSFSVLGNDEDPPSLIRTYNLPLTVLDPLIILLMFRQNICGNTFFQPLHHEHSESFNKSDAIQVLEDDGEMKIRFTKLPNFFQFYFNSSPSQLGERHAIVLYLLVFH